MPDIGQVESAVRTYQRVANGRTASTNMSALQNAHPQTAGQSSRARAIYRGRRWDGFDDRNRGQPKLAGQWATEPGTPPSQASPQLQRPIIGAAGLMKLMSRRADACVCHGGCLSCRRNKAGRGTTAIRGALGLGGTAQRGGHAGSATLNHGVSSR